MRPCAVLAVASSGAYPSAFPGPEVFLVDVIDPRDSDPRSLRELAAWLAIQRRFALAPEQLPEALPAGLRGLTGAAALDALGLAPPGSTELATARRQLVGLGARLLPLCSSLYPPRLRRLSDPPPVLVLRGNPALLRARCVSVVGARAATSAGRRIAREWAGTWARAGLVVVSGLARGVDAKAHEGALEAGGATVAFLACGADRIYPPEHRGLAARVAAQGAVITELPLGAPPRAPYFPLRNRLISGVAEALVVVEARRRSGSLVTARHAADQGVEVYAVPGPVGAATSAGPHTLLRDGARPLSSAGDLLEDLGLPVPSEPAAPAARTSPGSRPGPVARAVLRALAHEPCSRDALARRLGVAPSELATALLSLELEGRVSEDRDGLLRCV